jgi:flavodoxin
MFVRIRYLCHTHFMNTIIDQACNRWRNAYMNVKNTKGNAAKCLIAFFSRPGNNYVNGSIVNLPVGNTEIVAKMIREMTGGDLFHIEAVNAYPGDYSETSHHENMASYDMIFLGYPTWWGTMPMPVLTFLEEYDFSGKTITPFCTHEGSGLGRSVADIRKTCPKSTVLEGLAIRGGEVNNAREIVSGWLRETGMKA